MKDGLCPTCSTWARDDKMDAMARHHPECPEVCESCKQEPDEWRMERCSNCGEMRSLVRTMRANTSTFERQVKRRHEEHERNEKARHRRLDHEMRGMYADDMDRLEAFIREKFPAEAASMTDTMDTAIELLERLHRWET